MYFSALPSLLTSSIDLVAFMLVHVHFLSSIATESVWCHCGLVFCPKNSRAFDGDPQPPMKLRIVAINDSIDRQ